MAGYILRDGEKSVVLRADQIDRLLGRGDGDAGAALPLPAAKRRRHRAAAPDAEPALQRAAPARGGDGAAGAGADRPPRPAAAAGAGAGAGRLHDRGGAPRARGGRRVPYAHRPDAESARQEAQHDRPQEPHESIQRRRAPGGRHFPPREPLRRPHGAALRPGRRRRSIRSRRRATTGRSRVCSIRRAPRRTCASTRRASRSSPRICRCSVSATAAPSPPRRSTSPAG